MVCVYYFRAMSLQLRGLKSRLLGLCKQNERAAATSGWLALMDGKMSHLDRLLLLRRFISLARVSGPGALDIAPSERRRLQCLRCHMANASAWRVLLLELRRL